MWFFQLEITGKYSVEKEEKSWFFCTYKKEEIGMEEA